MKAASDENDLMKYISVKSKLGILCSGSYLWLFGALLNLDALAPPDGLGRVFVILCGFPWFGIIAGTALRNEITVAPIIGVTLFALSIFLNASIFYAIGFMISKLIDAVRENDPVPEGDDAAWHVTPPH